MVDLLYVKRELVVACLGRPRHHALGLVGFVRSRDQWFWLVVFCKTRFVLFGGGGTGGSLGSAGGGPSTAAQEAGSPYFLALVFGRRTVWMFGRTPPDAMVTPPSSL
eukprot:SAG22_NODE_5678_length_972_cov_2.012600_1_plen_106_part_10